MVAAQPIPDLGKLRGLSDDTLKMCNVRAVGHDFEYGPGWLWDTYTADGRKGVRWKSVSSTAPAKQKGWAKYRWYESKPDGADLFDPTASLKSSVEDERGTLWIVGGEIAAMSMFEANILNTTCFFGDQTVPSNLVALLNQLGVTDVRLIPDRDHGGLDCAKKVRDLLSSDLSIEFTVYALPYDLQEKHGKDVNDFWLQEREQGFFTKLVRLPKWRLPEPEQKVIEFPSIGTFPGDDKLPDDFKRAILQDVQNRAPHNKPFRWDGDGWSTNFPCPFHDDKVASAGFNRDSMSFKCFAECGAKSAKEYGERVGIHLRDYFDPIPVVSTNGKTPHAALPETKTIPPGIIPKQKELMPPLPAFAQLTDEQKQCATEGRRWLNNYVEWAQRGSPLTPSIFHEAMGIWLLATASTRRMKVRLGTEDIYPNLYILIVGKTTVYRKSTAMKLARSILQKANLSSLLLPSEVTPEALFDELAGIKPSNFEHLNEDTKQRWIQGRAVAAQRSFMKDEASSIFAAMKKEYMQGLSEMLLQGYDGDAGSIDKLLKGRGLITVKDLCVSFLGATTPVMYSKHVGSEEQENGFIARFAIVTPDCNPEYRSPEDSIEDPVDVIRGLRHLFMDVLPWHGGLKPSASPLLGDVQTPPVASVVIPTEAFKTLDNYRKAVGHEMPMNDTIDDTKSAAYARIGTMAYKIAMLFAAVDARDHVIRIEPQHAYAAQLLCEKWRESLHRLDRDIAKAFTNGADDDRVLGYIRSSGAAGVSMRDISKNCNVKERQKLVNALTLLADDGLIEKYDYKPEGRGRPTVRYRLASNATE